MPFDETATENLFAELADEEDPTVIEMDGIATLCEKLDIDPETDIRILVLLWKLGSKEKPAQISKDEFMSGCYEHQLDSIEKFKAFLPSLDTGFLDQDEFKSFYKVSKIARNRATIVYAPMRLRLTSLAPNFCCRNVDLT